MSRSDAGSEPRKKRGTDAASAASGPTSSSENVKVICRVRPFGKRELELQEEMNAAKANEWERMPLRSVINMENQKDTVFLDHEKGWSERQRFGFDHSVWSIPKSQQAISGVPVHGQEEMMRIVGDVCVDNVWKGFNTCVFAYGQTGSGKTHTMMGSEDDQGLIPRICQKLFGVLEEKRKETELVDEMKVTYKMEARFLEIYNEKVKDLLWAMRKPDDPIEEKGQKIDQNNLKIRLIPKVGPQVIGLTTVAVDTADDCMALIEEGTRNRSVAATKMNETSSRSHSIFRITLTQIHETIPKKQFEKPKQFLRTSVISLVDLAGSERNKKTGAEGQRMKEAVAINQSLTTLKNVIDALVEGRAVVPYRDSTLTWLLSDNLGGNSKTFMIACVSPHLDNAEETLNTLRYAMRTSQVKLHATVNESEELRRMARMKEEMLRLKSAMLENPHEDMLKQQYAELQAEMERQREEQARGLEELDKLNAHLAGTKDMQFAGAYTNAFKKLLTQRQVDGFRSEIIRLSNSVSVEGVAVEGLKSELAEEEHATKAVAKEERLAVDQLAVTKATLSDMKIKAAQLELVKNDLLTQDAQNSDMIERKAPLVEQGQKIGSIYEAYQAQLLARERNAQAQHHQAEFEAVRADEKALLGREAERQEQRVIDAKAAQDELRKAIVAAKAKQLSTVDIFTKRNAHLHSQCIFYENENKRVTVVADQEAFTTSRERLEKYHKEEEAWRIKLAKLHQDWKIKVGKKVDEIRGRGALSEGEASTECDRIAERGAKHVQDEIAIAAAKEADIEKAFTKKVSVLAKLNDDSTLFIRESSARNRYRKLAQTLSVILASKQPTDEHVATIVSTMRRVPVHETMRSILPTTLIPPGAGVDNESIASVAMPKIGDEGTDIEPVLVGTPRRSLTPRAMRSASGVLQPTGPTLTPKASAAPSEAGGTSPTPRTPRSAVKTPQHARLASHSATPRGDPLDIRSLRAPKGYTAQPTRAFQLRAQQQAYRKAAAAAASPPMPPPTSPAPVRPQTPKRSDSLPRFEADPAERIFAIAADHGEKKKIAVGLDGTFLLSRAKSPAKTRSGSTASATPKAGWK